MKSNPIDQTQDVGNKLLEYFQNRRFKDAENLAELLTKKFPTNQFAWKALWAALQKNGKIQESLAAIKKTKQLSPQDHEVHYSLGTTLQKLKKFKEAKGSFIQAITLKSDYYLAHYGLGITFKKLASLDDAEACFRRVIELNPDYYLANYSLGTTLQELGRLGEAEKCYRQVIEMKPDDFKAYNNLGNLLTRVGRLDEAYIAFMRVVDLNREFTAVYRNLGTLMKKIRFKASDPGLYPILIDLLEIENSIRPQDVAGAIITLLKHDPIIKDLLEKTNGFSSLKKATFNIESLHKLEILHQLMRICPLPDLELEKLFVNMRRFILVNLDNILASPKLIYFLSSLSLQCFTNEYIFCESMEETRLVAELEEIISGTILESAQPEALKILCLSTYRPLHQYKWCKELKALDKLQEIKKRLVEEPLAEKIIIDEIAILGETTDNVSKKVRAQYEKNPYPRWIKLSPFTKKRSIAEFCETAKLQLYTENIKGVTAPDILVAGCGTGQHSLETASRFSGCHITAVDLSLASLAYAKRKTVETGFTNIEYLQADILNLNCLEKEFDMIESSGVLHHMLDPIAGWKVLTSLLKPGGLMRIGLYSESARTHIADIQKEIKSLGVGASDTEMREFRRSIINSSSSSHQQLTKWGDFFSLSMLRDLIFHEQEHCFTLPQIASCLDELGLAFSGFVDRSIISKFLEFHGKETNIYDLTKWHQYEEKDPLVFIGMYQFWCQKL